MYVFLRLLQAQSFYTFLYQRDRMLAAAVQAVGCRHHGCGGVLDSARYVRRPRGMNVPEEYRRRFSFTCRRCKLRTTPPSLLFLGRKVYFGPWVLGAVLMTQSDSAWSIGQACRRLPLSRRTMLRWRRFWRRIVPGTPFWRRARALFVPPVSARHLPFAAFERFPGTPRERLRLALAFVGPLTTSSCPSASLAR